MGFFARVRPEQFLTPGVSLADLKREQQRIIDAPGAHP